MEENVEPILDRVRERVASKTLIQDMSEPLSGAIDPRRIAGKLNNLESAVGELAQAVDAVNDKVDQSTLLRE